MSLLFWSSLLPRVRILDYRGSHLSIVQFYKLRLFLIFAYKFAVDCLYKWFCFFFSFCFCFCFLIFFVFVFFVFCFCFFLFSVFVLFLFCFVFCFVFVFVFLFVFGFVLLFYFWFFVFFFLFVLFLFFVLFCFVLFSIPYFDLFPVSHCICFTFHRYRKNQVQRNTEMLRGNCVNNIRTQHFFLPYFDHVWC